MPIPNSSQDCAAQESNQFSAIGFTQMKGLRDSGLKRELPNIAFRIRFNASISRWTLQTRADNQFFWRTLRTDGLGTMPIWFLDKAEVFEYLEKIGAA